MNAKPGQRRVSAKELERELNELAELSANTVRRVHRSARAADLKRDDPELQSLVRLDLRRALEAEAEIVGGLGDEIDLTEREREIAKRALVNLKLPELRRIAQEHGLSVEGKSEALAERIAETYRFDEEDLARLILSREEEPRPDRGMTDRIYPLLPLDNVAGAVVPVLAGMAGDYIRVGVARWFVFDSAVVEDDSIRIRGTFRAYRADANVRHERFQFQTREISAPVELAIDIGRDLIRVRARGATETLAAIRALEGLTPVRRRGSLPLAGATTGELMRWDPRTLFLLDLLDVRFRTHSLDVANVTVLQFEMDKGEVVDIRQPRPVVRAVRLEGDWIGSSPEACELLAAGRPLVGASVILRFRAREDEFYLPSKVVLHRDHIDVLTGFAGEPYEVAHEVHETLLTEIIDAMRGRRSTSHLTELAERIRIRAGERGTVGDADILGPGETAGTAEAGVEDRTVSS